MNVGAWRYYGSFYHDLHRGLALSMTLRRPHGSPVGVAHAHPPARESATSEARRESELVLACARTSIDDAQARRIRALVEDGVDWTRVVDIARAHGVLALLVQSLTEASAQVAPPSVLEHLRAEHRRRCLESLLGTAELLKLLAIFEAQGIAVIPIKGPTLASMAYDDVTRRSFVDLDILLAKRDVGRAWRLLEAAGYRPEAHEAASLDAGNVNALGFTRPGANLAVELHWVLLPDQLAVPFDLERLRRRLATVPLGSRTVSTLSLEDTLLFLVAHGAKHEWERLIWICDVAELVARHRVAIDWRRILDEARATGQLRLVYLGVLLAADLLGARVPDVEPHARADRGAVALRDRVMERFFEPGGRAAPPSEEDSRAEERLSGLVFMFRARERRRDRARLVLRSALSIGPEERKVVYLPPRLTGLYHVVRAARLARGLGRVVSRYARPRIDRALARAGSSASP